MGSPGIGKVIKRMAVKGILNRKYSDYEGTTLFIDLLQWLYKFKISMVNSGHSKTSKNKNISHIKGLWDKVIGMLSDGILPIFVVDGKPPAIKKATLDRRRKYRSAAAAKLADENNETEREKLLKRSVYITEREINESKELLAELGIPCIQAIEEADPQCAGINITQIAYAVVSDDWDTLTYGSNVMITNFGRKGEVVEYHLDTILKCLDLTYEQFVELAIVLGCDYCESISCYSIKKSKEAFKLYEKYHECKDIEKLIKMLEEENANKIKYKIPEGFLTNWKSAKEYFLNPSINDPRKKAHFVWGRPNYANIKKLLMMNYEFSDFSVRNKLQLLESIYDYYSTNQSIINLKRMRRDTSGYLHISPVKLNCRSDMLNFSSKYLYTSRVV